VSVKVEQIAVDGRCGRDSGAVEADLVDPGALVVRMAVLLVEAASSL
jgi:hypothetical protein